ncbi:FHA domain-containing protein [Actinomadura rubrisoli]|uniref:FHA domain-containing protein n=1 Tax=Actinomadura rubrisoli TaxID=2530368 RepID=A0A4R5BBM6_9ACTN|nr:FHA domain-containing protein [Actinomadura rubrisoli]TDD82633.1 FHA domain-containing protein [Actinomadura rubrisoli]
MNGAAPRPGRLTVTADGRSHAFDPGERVLIGRAADCDVVLTDTQVSRRHLELTHDDGWVLHDLDTANGTWHEGTRLTARPITEGLSVRLGDRHAGATVEFLVTPQDADVGATHDLGAPPREPVPLRDRLTIGRARDNTVVLEDPLVSRVHARILVGPQGHLVQDLGSANLTFVNGNPIAQRAPLRDGDLLTCGRTRLVRVGDRLHFLPGTDTGLAVDDLVVLPGARDEASAPALTLRLRAGALLAVVGPSGAGKSTLLRLLSGERRPVSGRIRHQSQDVHANAEVRARIGLVPQDPVTFPGLTVRQALRYTADLRLPIDTDPRERDAAVLDALAEVGLADDADRRVARLTVDRQRRLAIAGELLTAPSLVLVDEPLAGLDPGLARGMMRLLRELADGGRHVVMATREPGDLTECDSVLVLAPGAQEAYYGPPGGLHRRFVSAVWADIFDSLSTVAAARAGLLGDAAAGAPAPVEATPVPFTRRRLLHQARIVSRRHLRLLATDLPKAGTLIALPLLIGLIAIGVGGADGLAARPDADGAATRMLLVLVVGMAAAGAYLPARDLAGERHVHRHEQAAGLLPEAYLLAKAGLFGAFFTAQAVAATALVVLARPGPADAVLLGLPALEIAVALSLVTLACGLLGMAISTFCPSADAVRLPVSVAVLLQLLLCGGLAPVGGHRVLAVSAVLMPARWGYAAMAATAGLDADGTSDALWRHGPAAWTLSAAVLVCLGLAAAAVTLWRLRR